ncbi:MAG: ABC transporter ATP-binding protein [Bacteroidales bacterium]|jgi:ABC-type lipoprotein export system ATPase subunit
MLRITGLSKSYLQRGIVLDNLELEVNEGDTIAVTGPSGSGKTTLLNLIGLLDSPDAGDILFRNVSILGFDSDRAADYRNRNIGFVFQDHLLMPHLTISENILLPVLARRPDAKSMKEDEAYCFELMDEVGISDLKNKYPSQISGGEAQRASLVRSLINRPSMLLADEPTGSLDAANADILSDLLVKMNRQHGISVITATHSPSLSGKMSRRLGLERGLLAAY